MLTRRDKNSQKIIKTAINLANNKSIKSAAKLMTNSGISDLTIDRVLYEPHNIRKSDLDNTLHLK
jgi:hypothetical protein